MGFAILLNEMMDVPMHKVAPIIAQVAENMILGDATRALRNNTGFLAKDLPKNEADAIAQLLNNMGIGCFVMDMASLYHPPDYQSLNTATLQEDGLVTLDYYGRTTGLDWRNLMLMSVGRILPHSKPRYTLGNNTNIDIPQIRMGMYGPTIGRAARMGSEPPAREQQMTKAKYVLDLFYKHPQEVHFRITSDGFNYSYLESRVALNSSENFKLLVEDVARFAPHVFGNRGTNAFLTGGDRRQMEFKDFRVFDDENLWMLQLVCLNLEQQ